MRIKRRSKILSLLLTVVLVITMLPMISAQVSAASPSDYYKLTKQTSFNKGGKFYMKFTVDAFKKAEYGVYIYTKLVDSSGKQVTYWNRQQLYGGTSNWWEFGTDYSTKPAGTYTFILTVQVPTVDSGNLEWTYRYTINNKASATASPSISFRDYTTYYNTSGRYMHSFNIKCTNIKGKTLSIKIYDQDGYLVHSNVGPERKTNNEVCSFAWSGYTNNQKYPSGYYTVVVTGGGKIIEKDYYLNIRERTLG